MGEYLPGNLQERLRELREANGFKSREKLAEVIGVNKTTYSRIENGSTKTISSDILLKLADLYKVPTDYILGLSDTPENTGYDIKELGLSVEAAKNLYSGNTYFLLPSYNHNVSSDSFIITESGFGRIDLCFSLSSFIVSQTMTMFGALYL